ncbi:MAG TPA: carbamoyl-phosphate synthase small subunit [Deltaproteobacteria bacterium]|nr:carbamoyl-phosphate synthase small subunit [Deltaproteobacteria bacterium]
METRKKTRAILALRDGTVFEGYSFGAEGESSGEVVFNTSMTGYQEIITDPSYRGQIVTMTYVQQGNYGVNDEDVESGRPWVEGFIVKEECLGPSNWRSTGSLSDYLRRSGIVGIAGIDTRALTRHIREEGAMEGVISTVDGDPRRLVEKARAVAPLAGRDLVRDVTCPRPYTFGQGLWDRDGGYGAPPEPRFRVTALDFGVKYNILRHLASRGCAVTVVPASTPAAEILAADPDGVFLSNGPGDPAAVDYAVGTVRELLGRLPVFGICLGHQILSLAVGARTYKLKFGHRGGNHPVMDLKTRCVEITAQNHGFAVDEESLGEAAELTHVNLNDGTVEGIALRDAPAFSVQYHPEASPGPHDSHYLFDRFVEMMENA